jgi:hypothetical protein
MTEPRTLLEDLHDAITTAEGDAERVSVDAEGPYGRDAALAYLNGMQAAYMLAEAHAGALRREVTVRPAYDCVEVQPCTLGGEACAAGTTGANHGRGEAMLHLAIYDRLREVGVRIGTGWAHPATPDDIVARMDNIRRAPRFPEVGLHSAEPFAGAVGPIHAGKHCPRGWAECYSLALYTGAEDAGRLLVTEGTDAVWAWLEQQWSHQFGEARADA